ncbi:MAG: hypothetical protein WC729_29410 [Sphingomonas sp.]|jgi:hypothetical protein|uniref:hypothetical protein n=1 Tax=Sphingomonas sp. TaxID=28214 RepID=UPI0035677CF7
MILGLCGHSGAGKDTFADRLVLKYGWQKVALADPLKRICQQVYDFTDQQLWGPSECRNAPDKRYFRPDGDPRFPYLTPREALQLLGTEWGRRCYDNTWVDLAIRTAKDILAGRAYHQHLGLGPEVPPGTPKHLAPRRATGVVIPDVRFKNELDAIRAAGGRVVRLIRLGKDGQVGIAGHASEAEQDGLPNDAFDRVLCVPEGLDAYADAIDYLMQFEDFACRTYSRNPGEQP